MQGTDANGLGGQPAGIYSLFWGTICITKFLIVSMEK